VGRGGGGGKRSLPVSFSLRRSKGKKDWGSDPDTPRKGRGERSPLSVVFLIVLGSMLIKKKEN